MSDTLTKIRDLVRRGEVEVSLHGSRELGNDDIILDEVLVGLAVAIVVEDYPDYHKGPSVLVLLQDAKSRPVHVLWGYPKDKKTPAVLITAYRPDPKRWSADFLKRVTP
jgi:hypothetical protein